MLTSFREVINRARDLGPVSVAVAAAEDLDVLRAIKSAEDLGMVRPILVGRAEAILEMAHEISLKNFEVLDQPEPQAAAKVAIELTAQGRAKAVMKGMVNTTDFMRAVLAPDTGLRTGRRLSHLAALERPGEDRLIFLTDGAMVPAPDLAAKKEIMLNALDIMERLGYQFPRVALMAANEQVNPKIPATADAAALLEMAGTDETLRRALIEGPIALDVAICPEAARHKNIHSRISGQVDLFLAPNLEAGNIFIKSLLHWGGASMAGLVAGAAAPVILTSRSDTPTGKVNSIALALLAAT